jgi:hypothetical protein
MARRDLMIIEHGVDERTFHQDMREHVPFSEIKVMGKYVLRRICDSGKDNFAVDSAAEAYFVERLGEYKSVTFNLPTLDMISAGIPVIFNQDGYVIRIMDILDPVSKQPIFLLEQQRGYLLREVSLDTFDQALRDQITDQQDGSKGQ